MERIGAAQTLRAQLLEYRNVVVNQPKSGDAGMMDLLIKVDKQVGILDALLLDMAQDLETIANQEHPDA